MSINDIVGDILDLFNQGRDYEAAEWEATKDFNLDERQIQQIRRECIGREDIR